MLISGSSSVASSEGKLNLTPAKGIQRFRHWYAEAVSIGQNGTCSGKDHSNLTSQVPGFESLLGKPFRSKSTV